MTDAQRRQCRVRDAPIRVFHWVNFVAILSIVAAGILILYHKQIGTKCPAAPLLMRLHVWLGYVLVINLGWRFVWAFLGNRYARRKAILPGGPGFPEAARAYGAAFVSGEPQIYLGHDPLARITITAIFALLVVMSATGLVLAGTDLYHPPFGHWIAQWLAPPGVDPASLDPASKTGIDARANADMRAFRSPFITVHVYGFWCLAVLIPLRVLVVVMTGLREGGGLISAMVSGRKTLPRRPIDAP